MTTIHYTPFECIRHKCHPLSAVSTPRTRAIFKTPNLQLSEILLNAYLRAAGSFCSIPLLCTGAEINHPSLATHQCDFWPRGYAEQHRQREPSGGREASRALVEGAPGQRGAAGPGDDGDEDLKSPRLNAKASFSAWIAAAAAVLTDRV